MLSNALQIASTHKFAKANDAIILTTIFIILEATTTRPPKTLVTTKANQEGKLVFPPCTLKSFWQH